MCAIGPQSQVLSIFLRAGGVDHLDRLCAQRLPCKVAVEAIPEPVGAAIKGALQGREDIATIHVFGILLDLVLVNLFAELGAAVQPDVL